MSLELLPITLNGNSKEVFLNFETDLLTDGQFITDENGLELNKRKNNEWRNNRFTGENLYPVTSTIAINSFNKQGFFVGTDRCQAGTSRGSGQINLLVNRIHENVDHGGIFEPLQVSDAYVLEYDFGFKQDIKLTKPNNLHVFSAAGSEVTHLKYKSLDSLLAKFLEITKSMNIEGYRSWPLKNGH